MSKIIEKTCIICLCVFQAKSKYTKCCGKVCSRKLFNISRYGVKEEKPITSCETCGITPEKKYSTGRFCSKKCACSFSTSHARKQISEKTRKTLKDKIYPMHPKRVIWESGGRKNICNGCSNLFEVSWDKRHVRSCSKECYIKHMSEKMIQRNVNGNFFQSFGRRIKYTNYGQDIHCDSLIEWCALEDFFEKYGGQIVSAKRSKQKIPYVDDKGNQRTYNPDFDIVMCNGVRYCVECKSEQFGFNETWIRYHNESQVKKKLLEDFCKENDMIPVWFTQKTRKDLYRKLKKEYVNSEEVL
jgi:hypothetical protein